MGLCLLLCFYLNPFAFGVCLNAHYHVSIDIWHCLANVASEWTEDVAAYNTHLPQDYLSIIDTGMANINYLSYLNSVVGNGMVHWKALDVNQNSVQLELFAYHIPAAWFVS